MIELTHHERVAEIYQEEGFRLQCAATANRLSNRAVVSRSKEDLQISIAQCREEMQTILQLRGEIESRNTDREAICTVNQRHFGPQRQLLAHRMAELRNAKHALIGRVDEQLYSINTSLPENPSTNFRTESERMPAGVSQITRDLADVVSLAAKTLQRVEGLLNGSIPLAENS